jgi:hypothetical protein
MQPIVTRSALRLAALLVLTAPAFGQSAFLYTLRDNGALLVNGTLLEKSPGAYDATNQSDPNGEQRYLDLAVVGKDRYALRLDGRVQKNGSKLHQLPFVFGAGPAWFRMHVDEVGTVYALRSDGMVVCNGQTLAEHDGEAFVDIVTVPPATEGAQPDIYSLRVDGSIFRQDNANSPGFKLEFDQNPDFPEPDGFDAETQWFYLDYDEASGRLIALRADGVIMTANPDLFFPVPSGGGAPSGSGDGEPPEPPNGVLEAVLPFNLGGLPIPPPGHFYSDLALRQHVEEPDPGVASADWYAIRLDGRVFSSTLPAPAPDGDWDFVVDLPGDGLTSSAYVSVAPSAEDVFAMRLNGFVYRNDVTEPLLDVSGGNLVRLAVSLDAPDGTKFKNRPPQAAIYKTKLVTDEAITIPVFVADFDLPTDQIIVEPVLVLDDEEENLIFPKLPGATWDAKTREVTFPGSAVKGNFRFQVTADDGSGKKPKKFTYPVRVFPPDSKPDKNRPPVATTIKKILAFAEQEVSFPLFATDKDVGDVLTFEVVDLKGKDIFDEEFGAEFDAETAVVTWTPQFEHLGKHRAVFFIRDDGEPQKKRKLTVRFEVAAQLVFDTLDG